jgi:predicted DNA-binding ribbon-helix-helix protein
MAARGHLSVLPPHAPDGRSAASPASGGAGGSPGGSQGGRAPGRLSGRPAKRSFTIGGHRTSISLEGPFWDALKATAEQDGVPVARLIARIDAERAGCGLSSAIRVWLLARYRKAAARGGASDRPGDGA